MPKPKPISAQLVESLRGRKDIIDSPAKSVTSKLIESKNIVASQVYGMDTLLTLAYACILSKSPLLVLGEPQMGKSHTLKLIASHFGERDKDWYYRSFTATTTPEMMFGYLVAEDMLQGRENYNLSSGAMAYKGLVLDELYKSKDKSLNDIMMSFLDESPTFFNNGVSLTPPYEWVAATSNLDDLPHDLSICPRWERMGAKYIVPRLSREQSRQRLKQKQEQRQCNPPAYSVSWDDLAIEREKAMAISLPESVEEFFFGHGLDSLESRTRVSQGSIERLLVGKPGLPAIMQSVAYMLGKEWIDLECLKYSVYWLWSDLESYEKFIALPQQWVEEGAHVLESIVLLGTLVLNEMKEIQGKEPPTTLWAENLIDKVGNLSNQLEELVDKARDKEAVLDKGLLRVARKLLADLKEKAEAIELGENDIPF